MNKWETNPFAQEWKKKNNSKAYNIEDPARQKAIQIIEQIIEPVLDMEIDGVKYFDLEDALTDFLTV